MPPRLRGYLDFVGGATGDGSGYLGRGNGDDDCGGGVGYASVKGGGENGPSGGGGGDEGDIGAGEAI
jgi:hypothetical protein